MTLIHNMRTVKATVEDMQGSKCVNLIKNIHRSCISRLAAMHHVFPLSLLQNSLFCMYMIMFHVPPLIRWPL